MHRWAVLVLSLTACGDNHAPQVSLEEFLGGRQHAECTRLARCGLFSSEFACDAYFRAPNNDATRAAIGAKKITYDGAAALECLDALAAIGCDKTQQDARVVPNACMQVFTGRVADGASCAFDDECRSRICDAPTCTRDMCCPGTCAATVTASLDDACMIDSQCPSGSICGKTKTCRALVAENMPCEDVEGCAFGLACVGVTDLDAGTCRKLPFVGESCPYKLCSEIGAKCVDSICAAVGLPGVTCMLDNDCSTFAECDEVRGLCIERPSLGMPCDIYCSGSSWCNAGICVAPLPDGEICGSDDQCASTDCAEGPVFDECSTPAVCY